MQFDKHKKPQGFTLIELMIVVGIIGVISALAIPEYSRYVVNSQRSEAQEMITTVMFEMERFSTRNRTYTNDMTALGFSADPIITDNNLYQIDAQPCAGEGLATCVNLVATPIAGSSQEGDGNVSLDTRGVRSDNWKK